MLEAGLITNPPTLVTGMTGESVEAAGFVTVPELAGTGVGVNSSAPMHGVVALRVFPS